MAISKDTKKNKVREPKKIFISYSHQDSHWLDEIKTNLKVLELNEIDFEVWDDTKIHSGANWKKEIEEALNDCKIAILIISTHFLASDFIQNNELPLLLKKAEKEETTILPLIVGFCRFTKDKHLKDFQPVNNPNKPLISCSAAEVQRTLVKLTDDVEDNLLEPKAKKKREDVKPTFSGSSEIKSKSQTLNFRSDNSKSTIQLIIEGEDHESFDNDHLESILASILRVDKTQIKILKVLPGSIKVILELKRQAAVEFSKIYQSDKSILTDLRDFLPINEVEWWDTFQTYKLVPESVESNISQLYFQSASEQENLETLHTFNSELIAEELLKDLSKDSQVDNNLLRALFRKLIPEHFRSIIKSRPNVLWIMDVETASYPLEMFMDMDNDRFPTFVNVGLIRNVITKYSRTGFTSIKANTALIIGDPHTDGFLEQIPGASEEANLVFDVLKEKNFTIDIHLKNTGIGIINSLFSREHQIIHLTGHGVYNPNSSSKAGIVIGKDLYLTALEIASMPVPPELVFVNCCHPESSMSEMEKPEHNYTKFAAFFGTELIEAGVKAVVVAGWAIDNGASQVFIKELYSHVLDGYHFGKAVKMARKSCYYAFPEDNTWGAFQCYGDPWFELSATQIGGGN